MIWNEGTIIENRQWNERLFSLVIDAPKPDFKAGQFIRVGIEQEDEVLARPYSLVNSPGEKYLEILFNIVPEGPLSPRLAELQAGENIKVAPKTAGFLVIDEVPEVDNLWMLATGTAIGPFLSILKDGACFDRFKNIVLCYSIRDESELCYRKTIDNQLNEHGEQLHFVPFITREKVEGSLQKRIPQGIDDGSLEERVGLEITPDDNHVMICGSSAMMTDAVTILNKKGLVKHLRREPGHISTEKYH